MIYTKLHNKMMILSILLIIIDLIFLNLTKTIFNNQIKNIQQTPIKIKYIGIIITYLIMIFGYYWFIIKYKKSTLDGFIYGFVIYGIYEFTNYSIFDKWNNYIILIDIIWGTLLHGILTYISNNLL
jgi:uncharacterized membrane protein